MAEINHVIITGQSLAVQPSGASLSGTQTRPTEITYFSGGSRLALEKANQWPERSFADTAAPSGYYLNIRTGAVSGQPYTGLKKGTSTYTGNISNLQSGYNTAISQGHTVVVRAMSLYHGEADSAFGTGRATYLFDLQEWLNDYNTDCKAITGQSYDMIGFAHQVSTKPDAAPAYAVLDAHRLNNRWYAVGPIYQLQLDGGVHPNAVNTFRLGELHAKVYRAVVVNGGTWNPVAPTSIIRTGTSIVVKFSVTYPPLVFDTTLFHSRTNYGFGFYDTGNTASISNVALTGADEVTITLNQIPTGGNERLVYGPPASTFGGNLRDSDSTVSTYDGYQLYNWCCYFDDPVTGDAGPEPVTHLFLDTSGNPVVQYQRVDGVAVLYDDNTISSV